MLRVWLIDDESANGRAWLDGFSSEIHDECDLRVFVDWPTLRMEMERNVYPHILFLDFFIGGHYGSEVLTWLDSNCAPRRRPVIVAHSSLADANAGMRELGADCSLPKRKGERVSASIASCFKSVADLEYLLAHRGIREPR